jgi:S1-C subfamily serine protease
MSTRLQLVTFTLTLLAGCVSSGTQVEDSALTQFQTGATTTTSGVAQAPGSSPTSQHAHKQAVGATFAPDPDGLRVVSVEKNGPAARAGLTAGDLITDVDGKPTAPVYWEYAAQNITNAEGTVTLSVAGREDLSLSMGGARTEDTTNPAPNVSAPPVVPRAGAPPGAAHVRLGVHCTQVTAALAQVYHLPKDTGVRVVTVEAGSVAESGGIRVGDVLVMYGDRSLNKVSDLTAAIAGTTTGADVPITVWRRTGKSVVKVQF